MLKGEDIIYVCEGEWSFQRGGHMSSMFPLLLENNRILYLDLPTSSQVFYKQPKLLMHRLRRWRRGLEKIKENFYTYSPFPPLPLGNKSSLSNRLNALFLAPFLKGAVKKLAFKEPILLIQRFNSADLVGMFDEKISCYLCVDEYSFTTNPNVRDEVIREIEKQFLSKVDLVFTTSTLLYEDKKRYNPRTYLVPNAADASHFRRALSHETKIPEDIVAIPSPIIGLTGTSPARLDFSLLGYLAENEPSWSIVLLGYLECPEMEKIAKLPNVHFLGWRDFAVIPNYLKAFDVCIIPFKVNEQTDTMNLYKLHEYVAAGKPVVSTPLFEVKRYGEKYPGIVGVAGDPEGFRSCIKSCLDENESVVERRLEVALENTWEERLENISKVIYACLKELGRD
ncbi:MAG: glycosyltransferase [Actinomycetota bacterium]|nr:glycosyltransferase [Actinomycetota bacterium]